MTQRKQGFFFLVLYLIAAGVSVGWLTSSLGRADEVAERAVYAPYYAWASAGFALVLMAVFHRAGNTRLLTILPIGWALLGLPLVAEDTVTGMLFLTLWTVWVAMHFASSRAAAED